MLLKQCYVQNFGKLQDFTYTFTEGLNVICAENGWGKSTLAAFLRAMFYGMPQAGSRTKLEEAERRKYKPWNGGELGGYLVFEVNKKTYKVERTFGKKEAEDTFRLLDLSTNLDSTDYSSELGKELFGLDREAYSRSTYLSQNKIFEAGMSDSIGKKLGRIAEGDEESGNFDKAYETLLSLRKKYIPERQKDEKGYVAELTRRIAETEERLLVCKRKKESAKPWREKEKAASLEKKKLEAELSGCRADLEAAAGYEAAAAKKQHYGELCKREETLRFRKESMQGLFSDGVPELATLLQCRREAEEAAALSGELRSYRQEEVELEHFACLQRRFSENIPEAEEIQEHIRMEQEAKERMAFVEMRQKEAEEKEKQAGKAWRQYGLLAIVSLLLCTCAGIGAFVLKRQLLWCGCTVCGAIGIGFAVAGVQKRKKAKTIAAQRKELLAQAEEVKKQGALKRAFLTRFGIPEGTDVTEGLYRLAESVKEYRSLLERKEKYEGCKKKRDALLCRSKELLLQYHMETEDIAGNLHILENRVRDFLRITEELEEASQKRVQFEQENPLESFGQLELPKASYIKLQTKEQQLLDSIARASEEETDCRNRAEEFEAAVEDLAELEETLVQLRTCLETKKREHFYITETMKCLKQAKEQFSSRYMKGLRAAFAKYVALLGKDDFANSMGGHFDGVVADIDLNVRVSAYGEERELGYFSTGYKDLLGLSMRFALVDALFSEERPVLVLDDPFVNLDEEKLLRAMAFLKQTAGEYQILYLVCHNSRA